MVISVGPGGYPYGQSSGSRKAVGFDYLIYVAGFPGLMGGGKIRRKS